jgi:hypothetical protein
MPFTAFLEHTINTLYYILLDMSDSIAAKLPLKQKASHNNSGKASDPISSRTGSKEGRLPHVTGLEQFILVWLMHLADMLLNVPRRPPRSKAAVR